MTVKVSDKYQVVIPEAIRRQARIRAGMEVTVLSKGGIIYIIPLRSLEDVAESLKGKFDAKELKEIREKKGRSF